MAVTAKDLFLPPRHVPGEGMAESVGRVVLWKRTDQITHDELDAGGGTYAIFNVPADTFIADIRVRIASALDGSTQATIGDDGDVDRFMDNTAFAPTVVGAKSMLQDTQPGSGGYVYTAANTIDLQTTVGTPTAGTLDIWVGYIPRASEHGLA